MRERRPAAPWIVGAGAVLLAGFFAGFGLTSVLEGGDQGASGAQETPAETPAPRTAASGSEGAAAPVPAAEPTEEVSVDANAQPSGDQPQSTETVDPVEDTVRAPCSVDVIRFLFDRERGVLAVFSDDGRSIASVARDSYAFDGPLCRGVPARVKPYFYDGLRAPVYESGGVSCSVPRGVEVEIHPILDGNTGGQAGNVLLVSVRGRPTVLASGVIVADLGGRRFSYSWKHCELL